LVVSSPFRGLRTEDRTEREKGVWLMAGGVVISVRAVGRRKPLLDDWSIPLPPEFREGGSPLTLRDLITRIVLEEVKKFRKRQDQRRLVHVLTAREIDEGLRRGKIDSGGRDLRQKVDDQDAVATALEAFEDGLYLVLLDGQELRELDREVHLQPDSQITFLRLVMLAGG